MDFLLRVPKENVVSFKKEYIPKLKSITPKNGVLYIEKMSHLDYKEENIGEGIKSLLREILLTINPRMKASIKASFI